MAASASSTKEAAKTKRFSYSARNNTGAMITGEINADSETAAALRLQSMGLAPVSVKILGRSKKLSGEISFGNKRVKAKHIAIFAKQFSTMIEAGLPLVRVVQALGDQMDHVAFKKALPAVQADLEKGGQLSVALSKHPFVFPPLMVGMVASGEVSGNLGKSLEAVAEAYGKEAALKAKVVSAMIYPGIVGSMAILMVVGMLIFVVPGFTEIFANLGGELPLPTRIMVAVSGAMKFILPITFVVVFVFSLWWKKNKNSRMVRERLDPFKLRVPIMGKFVQKIALARFSRTFASLLAAGVPLIQTLEITATTSGNIVVGDALMDVKREISSGKPIANTISEHPIFPPLVIQMVSTGEETGALPEMLVKIADFYEAEVDTQADGLASTLEPIMIIMLAGLVGMMVVSLYLPIFSVFDLIK